MASRLRSAGPASARAPQPARQRYPGPPLPSAIRYRGRKPRRMAARSHPPPGERHC